MSGAAEGVTLVLDAATYRGSVAVVRGREVLAERVTTMRGATEERLMPAVAEALAEAGVAPAGLARVVCGAGPGSFTSLRIAGAIAKGIALAHALPLVAVPTALLVVAGAEPALEPGAYLVTTDAMRGDRFAALVQVGAGGVPTAMAPPRLASATLLAAEAEAHGWRTIGPETVPAHWPLARGWARLHEVLEHAAPVDLRSWEPDYGRLAEAQVKWEAAHGRPLQVR